MDEKLNLRRFLLRNTFMLLLLLTLNKEVRAQVNLDEKKSSWILAKANNYFNNNSFIDALPYYEYLYQKSEDKEELTVIFRLGICYLYKNDVPEKSLELLQLIYEKGNLKKYPKLLFYLGRAYHINENQDKAIEFYKRHLEEKPITDSIYYKKIDLLIQQCNNWKSLRDREGKTNQNSITVIKILGNTINSLHQEYMPIVSADESSMIFTRRSPSSLGGRINTMGEPDPYGSTFDEDIYYSEKTEDIWGEAKPITSLNTERNDAAVALSADGQTLIFYRNSADSSGNLYVAKLQGDTWGNPQPISGSVNSEYWEGSACLNSNETMIIFTSIRPGGYGGRDLYSSKKLPNGEWSLPTNMGAQINTPYDEDSPFLYFDGKTLYFSTNSDNSIGGFDIVYSVLSEGNQWSSPVNVGTEINTPFDDKFYNLIANGNKAFYSSMKKGGHGLQDIYEILPGHFGSNTVFLLKGITYLNDVIGESFIEVSLSENPSTQSEHYSNSSTGKYLLIFPPYTSYNLSFSADGYETFEMDLKAPSLVSFRDSIADIYLYTSDMFDKYMNISGTAIDSKTGEPIAGVTVILTSEDGEILMEAITDENGDYIFRKVPKDKKYSIAINHSGETIAQGKATDLYGREGISNVKINNTFTEEDGSYKVKAFIGTSNMDVSGVAIDPKTGQPLPGVMVTLASKDGAIIMENITDKNGNYLFKGVPSNKEYNIFIDYPKEAIAEGKTTDLKSNKGIENIKINDDFTHADGSYRINAITRTSSEYNQYMNISGIAVDPETKQPLAGVTVILTSANGEFQRRTSTDENGNYLFKKVPIGKEYSIFVDYSGDAIVEGKATNLSGEKGIKGVKINDYITKKDGSYKVRTQSIFGSANNFPITGLIPYNDANQNALKLDKETYRKLLELFGNSTAEGLVFRIQVGAYIRPKKFKKSRFSNLDRVEGVKYSDNLTRFTVGTYLTLNQAEIKKKIAQKLPPHDAFITVFYRGDRMVFSNSMLKLLEANKE